VTAPAEQPAAPAPAPVGLGPLIFRACVVAIWSDGEMATAERDHLSHLIDAVASSDQERSEMRRIALHDVNRHAVLADLERLDGAARRHVFDRCVDLLASDRRLGRGELRFLTRIRRACGVGWWTLERVAWRAAWRRRLAVLAVLLALAVAAVVAGSRWRREPGFGPEELWDRREITLPAAAGLRAELAPDELYEAVMHSVVAVNVLVGGAIQGNGSGAVIGRDDLGQLYILTNRHVVYQELSQDEILTLEAELESGVQLPALLDFVSRRWDLALLVVPGLTGWAEPLPVVPRDQLRVGQQVYAVGSPMGLRNSFTTGVISGMRGGYIQTDATVHQGSSGGPLLDAGGGLCGVVTQSHEAKDISFAIYADTIFDVLEERRLATVAAD